MDFDSFLGRLDGARPQHGGQFEARCPAHDDRKASLSLREGQHGGVVLTCHAGCGVEDVVAALGLTLADIAGEPFLEATYVYTDEAGEPLYEVQRWGNPKTFRGRLPAVAERVPYQLPALAWARARGEVVYVCEGEKDCDRLAQLGVPATTSPSGAGHWYDHYALYLRDLDVVVVADNDPAGRAHARAVAASVRPHARSLVITAPRYGNDVSELLDLGFTLDLLDPIADVGGLGAINAANVRPRRVQWVWDGYVPEGMVTIFEGDPGDGKSILTVDLVARWTSGAPMPDGLPHGGPYNTVLITAEDAPDMTIAPRLIAAGADRSKVEIITHGGDGGMRPFDVTTDMPELYRLVMEKKIKIVVLDPLMAMIGGTTDSHNDASVRRALFPLFALASDTGCAVIVVRHLNKGSGRAIYRGGGSIGFVGAARAAYTIGRDADDPNRRIIACVKMNVAREPASLAYLIDSGPVGPFINWQGVVETTAQGIVDGHSTSETDDITEFLNRVVENGTPMTWREIVRRGHEEDGYTEKQLRSARKRSRLSKIMGSEGNRSVRWGYLEHQLAAEAVTESAPPSAHLTPPPLVHDLGPVAKIGQAGPSESSTESNDESSSQDEEERRDDEVRALPLACTICQTIEGVHKYFRPYWTVRCRAHSPFTYHETGEKK